LNPGEDGRLTDACFGTNFATEWVEKFVRAARLEVDSAIEKRAAIAFSDFSQMTN